MEMRSIDTLGRDMESEDRLSWWDLDGKLDDSILGSGASKVGWLDIDSVSDLGAVDRNINIYLKFYTNGLFFL